MYYYTWISYRCHRNMNSTYLLTGMKLAARYGVPRWEVLMEHLDWLLTESKFVVIIIADYIISHAHSTMQTNQSGDAESYQPNRSG